MPVFQCNYVMCVRELQVGGAGEGLTGQMTPVGGIVVTVALFAVTVTTVFGADDVRLLERRTV